MNYFICEILIYNTLCIHFVNHPTCHVWLRPLTASQSKSKFYPSSNPLKEHIPGSLCLLSKGISCVLPYIIFTVWKENISKVFKLRRRRANQKRSLEEDFFFPPRFYFLRCLFLKVSSVIHSFSITPDGENILHSHFMKCDIF